MTPNLFGAIDALRIPVGYLAELFTAGDARPVRDVLARLAAMRSFMRDVNLRREPDISIPAAVGMTPQDVEDMHRLLAIAKYDERYVIPPALAELGELEELACSLDYEGGPGMVASGPFGESSGGPPPVAGSDVTCGENEYARAMNDEKRIPWREVEPLQGVNGALEPLLKTVNALRAAWEDALRVASPEDVAAARERRLRRHAIETGIIERLYDLDWGVTEALVAEGLSSEVASRAGGISDDVLLTIRSQYDALDYVSSIVREDGDDLNVTTIRRLHVLITRYQATYEARNDLGQIVQAPLHHGEWKLQPNHVRRSDGTLLEYAPPEQVQIQIERLIDLYASTSDAPPVVRAAWLHHRFICIHPFEDGNGRVARALTLFVLLRAHYAPLVVDRRERGEYIAALDAANDGDLGDLVRFFVRLEIAALQSTLTEPARVSVPDAVSAIRAYADRLRDLQKATAAEKADSIRRIAEEVHGRIAGYLEAQRRELYDSLREVDRTARVTVFSAKPPDDRARYWRRQLVEAARAVDFYANLADGSWWVQLRLDALGERLRYLTAIQKVGHGETGVLAVTAYGELAHPESDEAQTAIEPEPALSLGPTDSVTLAYTDDVQERWSEIEEFLRQTLLEATEFFIERLG